MDFMKILNAVKLPIIAAIVLGVITIALSAIMPSSNIAFAAIWLILGLVFLVIGLAINFWAGMLSAKATDGAYIEGAIGAAMAAVIAGIITGILQIIVSTVTQKGVVEAGATAIFGIIGLAIGLVISAIIAAVLGAIGGYIARKK